MTIYQEEMQRKAQRYGCITGYDEESQMLNIFYKGVRFFLVGLLWTGKNSNVGFPEKNGDLIESPVKLSIIVATISTPFRLKNTANNRRIPFLHFTQSSYNNQENIIN